ncbi:MAG TPA: hypothetical protein DE179_00980 [Oceanospirillaceae bacterium]|nr:hypothetical protein [Oceanospirillaceae bacterium]
MNKQHYIVAALAVTLSSGVVANDNGVDEDSLFGSDEASEELMFGSEDDEGDLFADGLLSESEGEEIDLSVEFLQGEEAYALNGDFTLAGTTTRNDYLATGKTTSDVINASGTVTMDARPSASLRALVKADYSVDQDTSDTSLREAFVDWTIGESWYTRTGKQVMHWGVGYFYSPADLINSDSIDAADPEADRKGTEAVKLHYPTGNDNYYAYLVPQTGSSNNAVGLKGEWLIDQNELTMATVSRPSGHNSLAMTYYVPSSEVDFFAEYVMHQGLVSSLHNSSDWVSQATLGASYAFSEDDDYAISMRAQYYDDGVAENQYTAVNLRWASIYQSDYTLSLTSLNNTTDDSTLNKASLSYRYSDDVKATFTYSNADGDIGDEYSRAGAGDSVSLKVTFWQREY